MDNVPPPTPLAPPGPGPSLQPQLPTSSTLPPRPPPQQQQQGQAQLYSTRPRPAPARQGAPASQRNFAASSAGGATSHLGFGAGAAGAGGGPPPALGPPALGGGSGTSQRGPSPRGLGRGLNRGGGGVEGGMREDGGGAVNGRKGLRGEGGALSEAQKNKKAQWGDSYVPAEETIRNDYSSEYVQTGARPQNHLRNTAVETRFAEYPKLALLLSHKHALLSSPSFSIPPTYFNLSSLPPLPSSTSASTPLPSETQRALSTLAPSRFDSILLTPPPHITFEELAALDLARAAATPGFVWLWVGSGQTGAGAGVKGLAEENVNVGGGVGLEKGRELLSLWGYRRCEDIVWLKTNKKDPEGDLTRDPSPLFTSTIEHCLMGIRGTVRRSTDSNIVHCNVDTDVLVWEGDEEDPALKPPELQSLIENFCMGTRRLHLYGSPRALRRGWLTVSAPPPPSSTPPSSSLPSSSTPPMGEKMYSEVSTVLPVEKEGTEEEQRERWGGGGAKEWEKREWEARWRRPGPIAGAGGGMMRSISANGSGEFVAGERRGSAVMAGGEEVTRVESLLPFVEELDALRPKSPPQRNGVPSSGGLGRGRGAGLGVTRSGLVTQQGSQPSSGTSTPLSGVGVGRGRGRGNGFLAPQLQGVVAPPPPPPMGMPYPPPPPPPHPTGSAPPFPGYPYQQHSFPPPQMRSQQASLGASSAGGGPQHPLPMKPLQHAQLNSYTPIPPPSFPPPPPQSGYNTSSSTHSPHFHPQQLHPQYHHPSHPTSPFPGPPPSAPPSFHGYTPSPNPASPYAYHTPPPPPGNPYQPYHPHPQPHQPFSHSLSPSPALSAAQLPPGVAVHPDFYSPSAPPFSSSSSTAEADTLSSLLAQQHLNPHSPFPHHPSFPSSGSSGFSPSPGLSPVMHAHYLPRMPSNASLALSAGGGGGDVGPDGELIYPISSRRASVTSAASGGAFGAAGGFSSSG